MYLFIFLLPFISLAKEIDAVKGPFSDFDKIKASDDQLEHFDGKESYDILNLVAVLRSSNREFFIEDNSELEYKSSSSRSEQNRGLQDFWRNAANLNLRFIVNMYDDIRLEFPISFAYNFRIAPGAINFLSDKGENDLLDRFLGIKAGFWLSWKAVSFLRIGFRGSQDDTNGYLFSFNHLSYRDNKSSRSFGSSVSWSTTLFFEFLLEPVKWYRFEPEVAFKFNLTEREIGLRYSPDFEKVIAINLPSKFHFDFLKYLSLKISSTPKAVFLFEKDNSFDVEFNNSCQLEFTFNNMLWVRVPVKQTLKYSIPFSEREDSFNLSINTVPSVDFDWNIVSTLHIVADVACDIRLLNIEEEVSGFDSIIFKYGAGIKFSSLS